MSTEGGMSGMLRDLGHMLGGLFGGGEVSPERKLTLEVLFGLLGYLAKLDSLITSHEADFINHKMDELNLNMRERELVSEALQHGRNREIDLSTEFKRFREVHKPGSEECERLYDALLHLAAADERLRPKERQFLETATVELGFDPSELDKRLAKLHTK
ncbi:TerB family tellurite resistance protein [Pseudomarimonas arenosa]|uniref:TerB family tellurite resistance protein n=1 Tax=Pseudomarimonas arenosa TaxID=2774145 RepID=A0AAW3ZLI6_9GAMM|nr:TerB family tellurite resistance protein [Pseudomarimonas arenosa]MBD8526325.1 TerB family tellurite resistance protein [Pseudomarimonas arenosa]